MTKMLEADMSPFVTKWLENQGCEVYTEVPVPHGTSHIDLVGWNREDDNIVCVEMKRSLTKKVREQAYLHQLQTHLVYVAVATNPTKRSLLACEKRGIGVVRITNEALVLLEPIDRGMAYKSSRERLKNRLEVMTPGGVGGVPNLRGQGPAQECYDRVRKYREQFPKATWKEIYTNVSNHYVSSESLCGGMKGVEVRRSYIMGCDRK